MNVRAAAASALFTAIVDKIPLSIAIAQQSANIKERDQALLGELCYGTLRWFPYLKAMLDQLIKRPLKSKDFDIFALCAIGAYQLSYTRIPDHAALKETVDACRNLNKHWAKQFINGVLRQYQRRQSDLEQNLQNFEIAAHPEWFYRELAKAWPDSLADITHANNQRPPFTLRVNQLQISRDAYLEKLIEQGLQASPCSFSDVGITLDRACDVNNLPGFNDGMCSVQDEAAQLAASLLQVQAGHRVLDACAAPGGKTCHILEQEPKLAGLDALDVDANRLHRVSENLKRLKLVANLKQGDATQPSTWWDGKPYDRILVDAPCTASGVVRRHPDGKLLKDVQDINKLAQRQYNILKSLWNCLTPGGILVYATCSVFPAENEQVIARFVAEYDDAQLLPWQANYGISRDHGQQLLPQEHGHDGFFYARLSKQSKSL